MIVTEIFYGVKCDRCGEMNDNGEYAFWNDESGAIENAYDSDWREIKGKHYCENCHEVNEETDEIIVYQDYSDQLKSLIKFIDSVAKGTNRKVHEYNAEFVVKCSFYKKSKMEIFEENFIQNLLGKLFISLEYEQDKYNSTTCIIKLKHWLTI